MNDKCDTVGELIALLEQYPPEQDIRLCARAGQNLRSIRMVNGWKAEGPNHEGSNPLTIITGY